MIIYTLRLRMCGEAPPRTLRCADLSEALDLLPQISGLAGCTRVEVFADEDPLFVYDCADGRRTVSGRYLAFREYARP